MQEVKTLFHRVDSEQACAASDAIINALLADGWAIQATTIAACVGDGEYSTEAYLSVMLVRETQPAPVETPRKYKVGDRVRVTHAVIENDKEFVGKVGCITYMNTPHHIDVDFDGVHAPMTASQLGHAE